MTVREDKRPTAGNRLVGVLCLSALLGVSACSTEEEADVPPFLSDTEITLSLPEWTPIVQSRAALFEQETMDWLDETKGGRNFTLHAYMDGTGQTYMNGVRTYYFINPLDPTDTEWMMLDDDNSQRTFYWPNTGSLNFFAYMPNEAYNRPGRYQSKPTHVTLAPYTDDAGQQFDCNLPDTAREGETQEFIYAYKTGQKKQEEPVELTFRHPFAFINFKLRTGSYRMTANNITFSPIHLKGTFSTKEEAWTTPETETEKQKYTALINKRIPNDINYNTYLSEWFVVMPQTLEGVTLTFHATRSADPAKGTVTGTYTFGEKDVWKQGYKYTYIISCGDNKEEIYFNVAVEEWKIGDEQDINVE